MASSLPGSSSSAWRRLASSPAAISCDDLGLLLGRQQRVDELLRPRARGRRRRTRRRPGRPCSAYTAGIDCTWNAWLIAGFSSTLTLTSTTLPSVASIDLLDDRAERPARAAPRRPQVDDHGDGLRPLDDVGLERCVGDIDGHAVTLPAGVPVSVPSERWRRHDAEPSVEAEHDVAGHRRRRRHGVARRQRRRGATAPFDFDVIAGGHSNLTYRVTGADGRRVRAAPAAARPRARQRPRHGSRAPHHRRPARHAVPVPPALGFCDDAAVNDAPFYVMGFVDGHVVRDRPTAEAVLDADGARRARASRSSTRWPPSTPSTSSAVGLGDLGRHEGYIARQLKRWYGQWNAAEDARAAARRRGPRRACRRASPSRARRPSSTATTASTTAWSATTATSSPCSTGRSARSATRSPTSGCCMVYWTGPGDEPSAVGRRGDHRAGLLGPRRAAGALRRGVRARRLAARLLRRLRLLEAGLHPRGRVRPLPRRRARRARPGRAGPVRAARSTAAAADGGGASCEGRAVSGRDVTDHHFVDDVPELRRAGARRHADGLDRRQRRRRGGDGSARSRSARAARWSPSTTTCSSTTAPGGRCSSSATA